MEVTRALGGILGKSPSGPVSRNIFGNRQHQVLNRSVICGDEEGVLAKTKGLENTELARPLDKIKLFHEKIEENMTNNEAMSMKCFSPLSPPIIGNTKMLTNGSSKKVEKASNFLANKQTMENGVSMGVIRTSTLEPSEAIEKDTSITHGSITSNHQRIVDSETPQNFFYQNTNREIYISPINLLSSPSPRPSRTVRKSATGLGSPSLLGLQRKELRRSNDGKSFITLASPKTIDGRRETIIIENPTTQLGGTLHIEESTACESSNTCKSTPERSSNLELKVITPVLVMGKNQTVSTQNFQSNEQQLSAVPKSLLTPQRRKTTGIGLDKVGLGSPLVADLLDRRGSIGGLASKFVPGGYDQIILSPETKYSTSVERESRESSIQKTKDQGSRVAIQEKTSTNNLKEMIQSLTPNRRLIRGRKSLHVGGAKGILGKRPIELDEDDNDDEMEDFKRYKTISPFKSVLSNNATSTSQEASISLAESLRPNEKISEPSGNVVYQNSSGNQKSDQLGDNLSSNEKKEEYNQIQLQDFLDMTRIRFMELTTTKRRHTTAPKSASMKQENEKQDSLEDCIVAGATQIPMIELFQHACHELKRYISDGRKTVREIEKETWEENPPLFQEYLLATPDLKLLMDNQLKNVRTHARLLAKGLWYEWRMTLLNTLEGGLVKTIQDMKIDENTLDRQQLLLAPVMPNLTQTVRDLEHEESQINAASQELANCDQDKLNEARHRLVTIDTENKTKILLISQLQNELRAKEKEIELSIARKKAWKEEINEHEKIKEEFRGWTCTEVNSMKSRVCRMEEEYGWTITHISGTLISMIFRRELELTFDASSFRCRTAHATKEPFNLRIGLKYVGLNQETNCSSLTAAKDFFLQFIGSEVSRLQYRLTNIKDLLESVSNSWNKANEVINEVYLLTLSCPTKVVKISNNSIEINSTLILKPLATKIAIKLHLTAQSTDKGIEMEIMPDANVIYGERFNEPKMKEFLLKRCRYGLKERDPCNMSSWGIVVGELGDRLLARSRR
ncbi:Bgt-4834 [Blumeria graminis f. sp. tritici]|uniref:Bgt-4834 n=1 Tax=Blumeria graminis f. sp. tritici TaxID=62690 RepID=A0A9X9MLF6_BLUGR|nr:Bgt-4834 [Blumeria graminis f. sp. tritici]